MSGLDTSEELNRMTAQRKRQSSSTSTIELMVYVDAGLQNDADKNGFSIIYYILGILNIVSSNICIAIAFAFVFSYIK